MLERPALEINDLGDRCSFGISNKSFLNAQQGSNNTFDDVK